jgi:2-polyprenyl-3-methyl-5-hydroxy-6-metoxy-1,4-benzoquinol methylase
MKAKGKKIVHKVEEGMDPSEIYATTYQMRNFYKQLADGFFSSLDVMNYIQHHAAVKKMNKGDRVLDVCCGRGLLLALIRYYAKDIKEYVGVDLCQANLDEQKRWSGAKRIEDFHSYYPFKVTHVLASCEDMDQVLEHGSFDKIIYTSAIEHMQKEVGYRSLENCFNLLDRNGLMFLSCPNTMNKKDPYDTQYAAHLYEWDLDELSNALTSVGFTIYDTFGLVGKVRDFDAYMESRPSGEQRLYRRFKEYLPSPWLMSLWPILHPSAAAEVLILCGKKEKGILV